jgi:acyl-CoA thioester hydrolase
MRLREGIILAAPTDRYVCETTFYVRYAETDSMGIVHHANYLVYCEEARSAYSRSLGANYADFEKEGLHLVVGEIRLRFLAPAVYGQRITVRAWVEDLKSRRVTFGYEILDPDTGNVHVVGTTSHICTTHEGQVVRIPEHWTARWSGNPAQVSP